MALTWATEVRFGCATRRNEREKKLHLAANAYGGLGHRPGQKTLISISYLHFYVFFKYFGHFVFGLVFGPLSFLGPFRISVLIYISL